jgi:pimeloyl-ACP methyl ester carboxylesterase
MAVSPPPHADDVPVAEREIYLHGQRITYLESGAGHDRPVVVLLHGLTSSSATWLPVLRLAGRHVHVLAPDLLGHGRSAKPPGGDYSVGAYAASLRDLLVALGLDRATIVGHSLGGGVAMQFAYQFPEFVERLVLVNSGGLGAEVTFALRAATMPGSAVALRLLTTLTPDWAGRLLHRVLRASNVLPAVDLAEAAQGLTSLSDHAARAAFVHTTRGALNLSGQRLDATGKLYLVAGTPLLFIGGTADACIPVEHTIRAHERTPGSRLELFDSSGHFPYADHPERFTEVLLRFLAATRPSRHDREVLRHQLLAAAK